MKAPTPKKKSDIGGVASGKLMVRAITDPQEISRFDELLDEKHYLESTRPVGDFLRQVVERDGQWVAILAWGACAYRLKDRDQWIGWTNDQRIQRQKLVVQNRRFLLLHDRGQEPNLASKALAAATRALPDLWRERFGYGPLLAETFTDPEQFAGTCYKAAGWVALGLSEGNSRHRADFYVPNGRPKRLWIKELSPNAGQRLRDIHCAPQQSVGLVAAQNGVLPLNTAQMVSLYHVFRTAPDPRGRSTHFRTGPVLTIIAMALMAGERDVAGIARFATRLHPGQRAEIGLPRKKGTKAFYETPGYGVFYKMLRRMDPEAFAHHLNGWLAAHAGTLPCALALDGKMIRDAIGTVTLAEHEDGSPQALAIMDKKEGTKRCEQTAAAELIARLPALDNKTITADALHCQKELARCIVEKGGDYLLQIKGNQPTLLAHAKTQIGAASPFLNRAI